MLCLALFLTKAGGFLLINGIHIRFRNLTNRSYFAHTQTVLSRRVVLI